MASASESTNGARDKTPMYWDLLSDKDKTGYQALRLAFNAGSIKRNRGKRIETFDGILDAIRHYAEQHDEDDWRRFLICGVCWMDNAIAINTRQLRLLISKCKSSINGSLQKLGYITNTSHSESWNLLFMRIPLLKDNFREIRQWTIRYLQRLEDRRINAGLQMQVQPQFMTQFALVVPKTEMHNFEFQKKEEAKPPTGCSDYTPLKFRKMVAPHPDQNSATC